MAYRYCEVRADGRTLNGLAVVYGDRAKVGGGWESIAKGAFGDVEGADIILNVQHDRGRPLARTNGGGLVLEDSPKALEVTATLPETRDADDALALVRGGVLRGLSIEFQPLRAEGRGERLILSANLMGVGLVDRPAYPASAVQARAELRADGEGLEGAFFYDTPTIVSDREEERALSVRKESVRPGAFEYALNDVTREINLTLNRHFEQSLASRQAGTLLLEDGPDALRFHVAKLPDTSYARDFRASLEGGAANYGVAPVYRVPAADVVGLADAVSIIPETGNPGVGLRVVARAVLTQLSIVARAPRGNPGLVSKRARRWL